MTVKVFYLLLYSIALRTLSPLKLTLTFTIFFVEWSWPKLYFWKFVKKTIKDFFCNLSFRCFSVSKVTCAVLHNYILNVSKTIVGLFIAIFIISVSMVTFADVKKDSLFFYSNLDELSKPKLTLIFWECIENC